MLCRASYCLVLTFHIPFFFFTIKEFTLVVYDELLSRSLSIKLQAKLAATRAERTDVVDSEDLDEVMSINRLEQQDDGACSEQMSTKSGLTYKKMSDQVFFWSAVILQASLLLLALTVSSVEAVFQFIGAIGATSILFFFPGISYVTALRRFGTA